MECFSKLYDIIGKSLTRCLHKEGKKGTIVVHYSRINIAFNIWQFKLTVLWVRPETTVTVFSYAESFPVSQIKQGDTTDIVTERFLAELFSKQEEIWNLINTSQD